MAKFSKEALLKFLTQERDNMEKHWRFDPTNGYSQVEGKSTRHIWAFGRYDQLNDLIDDIENWSELPDWVRAA